MIAEELHKLMQRDAKPEAPEEFLRADEAAAFLKMSRNMLYKLRAEIPHEKVGRALYFTKSGLSEYVMRRSRMTNNNNF